MSSTLCGLISQRNVNWNTVRDRIGSHPFEANCTVTKPLHVTLGHSYCIPPADVLISLLKIYASNKARKLITDSDKLEILTVACYNSIMTFEIMMILLEELKMKPSTEFIYRLIKDILSINIQQQRRGIGNDTDDDIDDDEHDDDDGDGGGNKLSRMNMSSRPNGVIQALIEYWPDVLMAIDRNGNILLHHFCNRGSIPIDLLESILYISIQNQYHHNSSSRNEYCMVDDDNIFSCSSWKNNSDRACNKHRESHHGGLLVMNRQKKTPLHNLCRLLNNETEGALQKLLLCNEMCGNNLPIAHTAIKSGVQPRYVQRLMNVLNIEITTSLKDEYNRSLFQVAIDTALLYNSNEDSNYGKGLIQMLALSPCTIKNQKCDTNFGAMKQQTTKTTVSFACFTDDTNRLPLHYACEKGLSWSRGLEDVVNANHVALEIVDTKTQLYPFMLACNSDDLNSVYELLRRSPNVIQLC